MSKFADYCFDVTNRASRVEVLEVLELLKQTMSDLDVLSRAHEGWTVIAYRSMADGAMARIEARAGKKMEASGG